MDLRKMRPIYIETQSLKEFNDFFKQYEELLSSEIDKLNSEIKTIDDNQYSEGLKSYSHNEVYESLIFFKNEYECLKIKYGLENVSLNDLDSRKKYYIDKIKHYYYTKNISFFTNEKSIKNSIHEVYKVITFQHVFQIIYKILIEKLKNELQFNTNFHNSDYRLIYYYFYSYKEIEFRHNLDISDGKLEVQSKRLKELETKTVSLEKEIEDLRNKLSTEERKFFQLESYNQIIPNLHFQDFIIKIEYCDFRPLHSLISKWNLFIHENGNSVSLTHLIYLFDVTNTNQGLHPLPVNFINSTITIEEFGLFLYQIKSKLIKPRYMVDFENWHHSHFSITSKHSKPVTDLSRYIKPYKKQVEKKQMIDYLEQFLLLTNIKM